MDARTRSPAAFALPESGRGSSIKFWGVNLSFPVLKVNSFVDILYVGRKDVRGSWAANPKSVARGNHITLKYT